MIVVKKSDGSRFKVPLSAPDQVSRVKVDCEFVGGDGITPVGAHDLIVVANATRVAKTNAAFALATDDGWTPAKVYDVLPLGDDHPTTAVVRDGTIFVVSTRLDALLQAAASSGVQADDLRAEATIRPIGSVVQ